MSRPKSEATIQKERDREIRRQHRELKRREREERRAEHRARKERREIVRNGGPVVVKPDPDFYNYEALRNYSPWAFCGICRRWVRENLMHDSSSCELCYSEGEDESQGTNSSQEHVSAASKGAGADAPAPGGAAGQVEKEKAQPQGQAGQAKLQFEF